ncbi:hypothetical protein FJZ17_04205 [Candidatus Pacearchaeota archaeon]|nr:hypothetical protein [Candidatus Pacearchaeota archaeon]
MKKKERRILENPSFKRKIIKIIIRLLISLLVLILVLLGVSWFYYGNLASVTGKFVFENEKQYSSIGYAPPYDVLSGLTPKPLIMNVTPSVQRAADNQIFSINISVFWPEAEPITVYKYIFLYNPRINDWVSFTLNGNFIPGSSVWLNRSGTKQLFLNATRGDFFNGTNYILAYGCRKKDGAWRCGCANYTDAQCDKWMLQMFNVTNIENPSNVSSSFCLGNGDCASGNCTNHVCVSRPIQTTGTLISSCREINQPGDYYLNSNLGQTGNTGDCIIIHANDVVINGNYFTINGNINGNGVASTEESGNGQDGYSFRLNNLNLIGGVFSGGSTGFTTISGDYCGNGGNIAIYNSSISLDVSSVGAFAEIQQPGPSGGNILLVNSNVRDVSSSGGPSYDGGNSGKINLLYSTARNIYSSGGSSNSYYITNSGFSSEEINIDSSTLSAIYSRGGLGAVNGYSGNAGLIIIDNSSISTGVYSNGGGTFDDFLDYGGSTSKISVSFSSVPEIISKGGYGIILGGSTGEMAISSSNVQIISSIAGGSYSGGFGGSTGNINLIGVSGLESIYTSCEFNNENNPEDPRPVGGDIYFNVCPNPKPTIINSNNCYTLGTITPPGCQA